MLTPVKEESGDDHEKKIKLDIDTKMVSTKSSTNQLATAPQFFPEDYKKPATQRSSRFRFKVTEVALYTLVKDENGDDHAKEKKT